MEKLKLPNGMDFYFLNRGECSFLYKEIFFDRVYNKNGIVMDQKEDGCIFDIGANIGMSVLFFHQACPNSNIYAIEPSPSAFEVLLSNVRLHGINAKVFNCAISDKPGTAVFTSYLGNSALSGLYTDPEKDKETTKTYLLNEGVSTNDADSILTNTFKKNESECQIRTLSEIIYQEGIKRVDLLKIDVEKAEIHVLRGIDNEHWEIIEQIVMEIHSNDLLYEAKEILSSKGFQFSIEQDPSLKNTELYDLYAIKTDG